MLRRHLLQREGAARLIDSIVRLGFVSVDAVVVKPDGNGSFIIVEGNRRLAAIKTILNDVDRKVLHLPDYILNTLNPLEVKVIENHDGEAIFLQGIRHISGAKSWGPYQQGHLIHSLIEIKNFSVTEAAKAVGLSLSRASVILKGYYGLKQMFEDKRYTNKATNSFFSHFEYAHAKLPIRDWLEWEEHSKKYKNTEAFSFFCDRISAAPESHLYVSARDVRDILPSVLLSSNATSAFFAGDSISEAYKLCSNQAERLEQFLKTAQLLLEDYQGIDLRQLNRKQRTLLANLHDMTSSLLSQSDH